MTSLTRRRLEEILACQEMMAWLKEDVEKHEFKTMADLKFWCVVNVSNGMFLGKRILV